MMPDPLDVAFAALGNNHAVPLLAPAGTVPLRARSRGDAGARRRLTATTFWGANLYNLWLASLRALSRRARRRPATAPLEIAGTEAWGRRTLNTQLASWAELRHDTILYVKQRYTGGVVCEFPDALVEPSPELFARLARLRRQGQAGRDVAVPRRIRAGRQRGPALRSAGGGVRHVEGDGGVPGAGDAVHRDAHGVRQRDREGPARFAAAPPRRLVFEVVLHPRRPPSSTPTIADVHTQPTDEGGNPVGRVLHGGPATPG